MRAFQHRPLEFLGEMDARYGGVVRFHTGLLPVYLVSEPGAVKHILQDKYRNYSKNTFTYNMARSLIGDGLLTSDGDQWLRRRRLLQPLFHQRYIAAFAQTMREVIQEMLERWAAATEPLDLTQEMMRLTLRIAGKTLFSVDLDREAEEIRQAFNTSSAETLNQFRSPWAVIWTLLGFPSPSSQRFRSAQQWLDELLFGLIAERRGQVERPYDVLSLLLESVDEESGQGLSDEELRGEIGTLLFAGHETTALALTWTWILLAQHPQVEEEVGREAQVWAADASDTLQSMAALPYTTALFQEVLRLYPPAWGFSRRAVEDDVINGFHIPAGARVMLSPYVTQRSARYWRARTKPFQRYSGCLQGQ